MKRIFFFLIVLGLAGAPILRAEDAATEERLNKLTGYVDDLLAAQKTLQKRIAELVKEIESVRDQQSKPTTTYASHEDLKRLAEKLQDIDRKRQEDKELILKEIERLGKSLAAGARAPKTRESSPASSGSDNKTGGPATSEKGFEYVIESGDTLSKIAQDVFRQKGIKVTTDQILKANPGLDERKLRVGQKIFIPAQP